MDPIETTKTPTFVTFNKLDFRTVKTLTNRFSSGNLEMPRTKKGKPKHIWSPLQTTPRGDEKIHTKERSWKHCKWSSLAANHDVVHPEKHQVGNGDKLLLPLGRQSKHNTRFLRFVRFMFYRQTKTKHGHTWTVQRIELYKYKLSF